MGGIFQMKKYFYQDNVFSFEGSVSIQQEAEWVAPWRINFDQVDFYPFLKENVAKAASGVRLCFTTNSKYIALKLWENEELIKLDLFVNGKLEERVTIDKEVNYIKFNKLSNSLNHIEIWLDQSKFFKLNAVLVEEDAKIYKTTFEQKRWVNYGSSISHSNQAASPSNTWAAIVAAKLNLYITNLGLAGNCKIEPMMGLLISKLPADFITLKLGINVDCGELTPRTFGPNIIGLIQIIREKHPNVPLAVISPIYSPPREGKRKLETNLGLEEMRSIISDIVETCKRYGDKNIFYVDGLRIFGADELRYMPDELHPNAEGQPVLAQHFIDEVFNKFFGYPIFKISTYN